jgi:hypothetical protein
MLISRFSYLKYWNSLVFSIPGVFRCSDITRHWNLAKECKKLDNYFLEQYVCQNAQPLQFYMQEVGKISQNAAGYARPKEWTLCFMIPSKTAHYAPMPPV